MSRCRYRCKYTYEQSRGRPLHRWSAVGARGAMHLYIRDTGPQFDQRHAERYTGGIETHWRSPPDYMQDEPPTHDLCWLLCCPCWHDGSSLQATEFWIPRWLDAPHDHDAMFALLESKMAGQFATESHTPELATP